MPSRHYLDPLIPIGVLCLACSAPSEDGDAGEDQVFLSDSGALRVTVSGARPARGDNQLRYLVQSAVTGAPVDELSLDMTPFMPSMGHGASGRPAVRALGAGEYSFTGVRLSMPGLWELRTTITGAHTDFVAPRYEID